MRQKSRPSGSSFFSSTFHFFALAFSCTAWNKNVKHERKKYTHTQNTKKEPKYSVRPGAKCGWKKNIATKTQKGTELHNVCSKYNKQKKSKNILYSYKGRQQSGPRKKIEISKAKHPHTKIAKHANNMLTNDPVQPEIDSTLVFSLFFSLCFCQPTLKEKNVSVKRTAHAHTLSHTRRQPFLTRIPQKQKRTCVRICIYL